MKVAVVGSRNLEVENLGKYLPEGVREIVSGGAKGVDACAKRYAKTRGIAYREFLPEYARYKRGAPLKRNLQIVEYADMVLAFWDGESKGTAYTIECCRKLGKAVQVVLLKK